MEKGKKIKERKDREIIVIVHKAQNRRNKDFK